ncbi:response regulator [uncultured Friedmanniella sp.]|uniref:response regulator transcription factor n=1 Tax=uncultured Friedmanniella sp. TaxID=335381 RepID=UPI0035CA0EF2
MSVFIVDEEELVRRGLADLLTSYEDITVVGTASSAPEALPLIAGAKPQLVLLDARLPEGAGITACRALRAAHPELRCLVLTSFDDDEALLAAVLAGAAGYLVKQIGGSGILDGVRRVGQGQMLLDPAATEALLERLRQASQGDPGAPPLLPEERQVLDLVSQGWTDAQIVDELSVPADVVEQLITSIFAKLGPRGRAPSLLLGAGRRDLPKTSPPGGASG